METQGFWLHLHRSEMLLPPDTLGSGDCCHMRTPTFVSLIPTHSKSMLSPTVYTGLLGEFGGEINPGINSSAKPFPIRLARKPASSMRQCMAKSEKRKLVC